MCKRRERDLNDLVGTSVGLDKMRASCFGPSVTRMSTVLQFNMGNMGGVVDEGGFCPCILCGAVGRNEESCCPTSYTKDGIVPDVEDLEKDSSTRRMRCS